ncbi:RNA-directed DNA polymerase, eukaryota [Tanacetum coccineum]
MSSRFRSNEDGVRSISRSIFVTNFPDSTTAQDLWKICQGYGSVVDVFIPNRKSISRNRIVWVDIEGVPIHAWSRATFNKIGSKWGEVMEIEECKDDLFARKRICIKTSQGGSSFLRSLKIFVK